MRVDLCLNPRQFSRAEIREMIPSLRDLMRRHGVRAAYLFGSVRQGSSGPLSDLDIAVLPPPDLPDWFDYYNDLYGDLCHLFQADNIDLVLLNQAPLSLQVRVVVSGLRFLDGGGADDLEERALARYADLAGWRKENWDATRQLVQRGALQEVNMIDSERVERFVFLIRDAVLELQALRLADMSLEAYQADKRVRALSEHYMRLAIEAILDLGRHVIVRTGLGVPQEYRDVGRILREKGIVPPDLGDRMEAMAGMRNVLVHLYWDIDYALLYRAIIQELDTFGRCIEHIFRYMDGLEGGVE